MKNDFYSRLDDSRESGGYDKDKIDFLLSVFVRETNHDTIGKI